MLMARLTDYADGLAIEPADGMLMTDHADGAAELDDDAPADAGGLHAGSRRQLVDDRLQGDAADVAQLLLVRDHVVAEGVDDRLHLEFLHLHHQRAQADGGGVGGGG